MHVYDEITHLRVVNGLLRLRPPRGISSGIIRINSDDVELAQIFELGAAQIREFATENKMKQLPAGMLVRHLRPLDQEQSGAELYPNSTRHSRVSATSAACRATPAAISVPCDKSGRL